MYRQSDQREGSFDSEMSLEVAERKLVASAEQIVRIGRVIVDRQRLGFDIAAAGQALNWLMQSRAKLERHVANLRKQQLASKSSGPAE